MRLSGRITPLVGILVAYFAISPCLASSPLQPRHFAANNPAARHRIEGSLSVQRNLSSRADLTLTGGQCSQSSECKSNLCNGGQCWPSRSQPGQYCNPSSHGSGCNSNMCSTANSQCLPSALSSDCRSDDHCLQGACTDFTCRLRSTSSNCVSGACSLGVCDTTSNTCTLKPLGSSCSDGTECDSAQCKNGVCSLLDLGEECAYGTRCNSGWCVTQAGPGGAAVNLCVGAPVSHSCRADTDCGSNICGSIGSDGWGACFASPAGGQCGYEVDCRDSTPCVNGRCLATADAPCSTGTDCASGTCTDGVCGKITSGQGCGFDYQCRSTKCGPVNGVQCYTTGRRLAGSPCASFRVCQVNLSYGAPCTTALDCGAPYTVCTIPAGAQSGTCIYPPPTLAIGSTCQRDSQCLSGRCDAIYGSDPLTCRKIPGGQPCSSSDDCTSGRCAIDAGASTGTCAPNPDGGVCETALDCISTLCSAQGVCTGSVGAACTDIAQCGSRVCCQGQCQGIQIEQSCTDSTQCAGGICSFKTGRNYLTKKKVWPIGQCKTPASDGQTCIAGSACESGTCTVLDFQMDPSKSAGPMPIGQCGLVDSTSVPSSSYSCTNKPKQVGETCQGGDECLSRSCSVDPQTNVGTCQRSQPGSFCLLDTGCAQGGACDFATKTCKIHLLALGDACTVSTQCASGFCNPASSTCTRNSPLGSACDTTTDCAAGTCYQSVCSILPLGAPCSSADQCSSKYCQYGPPDAGASAMQICSAAPPFTTCTLSSECGSGKCSNSADTSKPGRCLSSLAGQACTVAMDCDGFTSCVNGKCLARAKTACTQGSDCQSGTCSAGQCTPAGANSGCISSADCASNRCDSTTTICGANSQGPCSTYTVCNPVSAMGGICSVDGDCTSAGGICAKFGSANPGTCTIKKPWPNSYTCGQASDCQSGYCRVQLAADGVTRESTGSCSDKKGLEEECYTNAGCSTGLICSNKSGTCISSVTSTTTSRSSTSTSSTSSRSSTGTTSSTSTRPTTISTSSRSTMSTTTSSSRSSTSTTTTRSSTSTTSSTSTRPTATTTSSTSIRPSMNSSSTSSSSSSRSSSKTTTTASRSTSTTSSRSTSTTSSRSKSTSTSTRSSTTTSSSRSTSTSTTTTRPPTTSTTSTRTTTSTSATPLPSAAACSTSTQCRSAYCRKRLLADGVTRETTGTCEDKKANGAACYTSDGCISTQCNLSTKLCVGLAANAPCASNAQCISSYCRQRLLADGTRDPNGTCDVQKARGSACYQNGGCTSGSCNLSTKVCN